MKVRPFELDQDFDSIKDWINDERSHAMWCANNVEFPISKESFGVLKLAELKAEDKILREIFKLISVKDSDGDSVLSTSYRQDEIRSAIRCAYWPSRKLTVNEEEIPTDAKLLDVQYLNVEEYLKGLA